MAMTIEVLAGLAFMFSSSILLQILITSAGLWSWNDSDFNFIGVPSMETSIKKLEVSNIDDDGLTFSGVKFWLNWIGSNARKGKLAFKFWRTDTEPIERQVEGSVNSQNFKPTTDNATSNTDKEEPHHNFTFSTKF